MAQKKQRALFEDASAQTSAAPPTRRDDDAAKAANRRTLSAWQFVVAALVVLIVIVGGMTRLTDSGLSITEWNVVTGILPPLTEAAWQAEFAKYQAIPEFTEQNYDFTLAEFKPIYWWEWAHRMLGRVIGLAYLLPFAIFAVRSKIPTGWTGRLLVPGLLILVQGAIGWWMVSSGLSERVDVAPYRLAAHLGMAFVIFGLLVWNGLALARPEHRLLVERRNRQSGFMRLSGLLTAVAFVQILAGALVAGLDAGRGYTDWPLMNGAILPPEATELSPFWHNFFENPALAQFDHRILGYILLALAGYVWWRSRSLAHAQTRMWTNWVLIALAGQTIWGILTVLNAAPLGYAILHQLGALIVFFLLIRTRFEAAYPTEQRIERAT